MDNNSIINNPDNYCRRWNGSCQCCTEAVVGGAELRKVLRRWHMAAWIVLILAVTA